ncbi:peptide/nickel transport system permease protein [Variovorax boronicumulans]|uniref:ABC transporter permease n=1 Tax=Variovorax boronicumulans TaxID=436515 RepID=UPI002780C6F0|nr:ABC transporter permease subunit [Variovorax boronicumulans]MDQ0070153.1 peptide/nickel transport system permease protein [Variovorax boronicumulans]
MSGSVIDMPALDLAGHGARRTTLRRRAGLGILALVAAFSLFGPALIGIDPARQTLADTLLPPSAAHWLGTDVLGRSVLARLAHAARLSLGLALLAALTAAIPGVLLGVAASWRGGRIERALVMLADAVLSVPSLLLVLLFAALAPGRHWALYIGLSLSLWVEYFRVCRAASRQVLASDAVQASRLLGFGTGYVLRRHLLPALAPVLGTLLAFSAAQAVLALAALGFIGVGLHPPTPEVGLMMTEFLPHYEEAPWLIAAPVALLMAVVLGMMLVAGDGETT